MFATWNSRDLADCHQTLKFLELQVTQELLKVLEIIPDILNSEIPQFLKKHSQNQTQI